MLASYVHALDPFLIEFPDGWPLGGIRWYGLSYMAGFVVAWLLVKWLARSRRVAIAPDVVGDLVVYVIVGVIVGGRLGYVLFYAPSLLVDFRSTIPFWGLLAINDGGMASHGGMLGVIGACWLFARRQRIPAMHACDIAALTCPPGLFFGRLANFVNAELPGRVLPAESQASPPWWSVKYPQDLHAWTYDRTADLEAIGPAVEAAGRSPYEWRAALERLGGPDGQDAARHVARSIDAVIATVQDGNEAVIAMLRPMLTAYYPSQLIQAFCEGPVLVALLILVWLKPRKPGIVSGSFLTGYGVLRIATEMFRQPDAGVPVLETPIGALSRGQVLSVLMIIAGLALIVVCQRRKADPLGGLLRPSLPSGTCVDSSCD
jgi:phosphatidylglycerol:prolipoprotein diacylglycerol transferase